MLVNVRSVPETEMASASFGQGRYFGRNETVVHILVNVRSGPETEMTSTILVKADIVAETEQWSTFRLM